MMRQRQMNPGSIHVRIAALQQGIEDAVKVGNLVVHANLLRRMRLYASVHMTETQKATYDALPGLAEDDRTPNQVYDDLCQKEEFLLDILKDFDVFAKGQHMKGDASALDELEEEVGA